MPSLFDDPRDADRGCGIDLLDDDLNEELYDDDERLISDERIRQQEDYELQLLEEEEQAQQQLTEDYEDELEYNYFYENGDY